VKTPQKPASQIASPYCITTLFLLSLSLSLSLENASSGRLITTTFPPLDGFGFIICSISSVVVLHRDAFVLPESFEREKRKSKVWPPEKSRLRGPFLSLRRVAEEENPLEPLVGLKSKVREESR
jgi:hypothetical protein